MMHLTYNRRNLLGDGCGALTPASAIWDGASSEMNRVGIILMSPTAASAPAGSSRMFKQAGCRQSLSPAPQHHFRAKSRMSSGHRQSGGYVGVCAISAFFRGTGK